MAGGGGRWAVQLHFTVGLCPSSEETTKNAKKQEAKAKASTATMMTK